MLKILLIYGISISQNLSCTLQVDLENFFFQVMLSPKSKENKSDSQGNLNIHI